MATVLVAKPVEVVNRLEEQFGLRREPLLTVVRKMVEVRRDCTRNDPAGSECWAAYQHGTRLLRDLAADFGYERDNSDQIEAAINKRLGVKLVVANTDEGTGLENHSPQNRSGKGPATGRVIDRNQLTFINQLAEPGRVARLRQRPSQSGATTYYLCVYHEGDEVRAELSCPVEVKGGFFADFVERILLIGRDDTTGAAVTPIGDGDSGEASEFDIPVARK